MLVGTPIDHNGRPKPPNWSKMWIKIRSKCSRGGTQRASENHVGNKSLNIGNNFWQSCGFWYFGCHFDADWILEVCFKILCFAKNQYKRKTNEIREGVSKTMSFLSKTNKTKWHVGMPKWRWSIILLRRNMVSALWESINNVIAKGMPKWSTMSLKSAFGRPGVWILWEVWFWMSVWSAPNVWTITQI